MKNRKSVARFITLNLIIGIILYAAMVILVVNYRLKGGLTNYFSSEIKQESQLIMDEFDEALKNSAALASNIQLAYKTIYPEYGFDRTIMNSFAEGAREYYGAKNIVFFNSFGMQVSSPKFGVVPKTSIIRDALNGNKTIRMEKDDADIYATVILPLLSEDKVFGAVEIRTPVSTMDLAQKASVSTKCDFTIFDGNVRHVTTLENMQGTVLEDDEIFEEVKNGREVFKNSVFNGHHYVSYYFPYYDSEGNFLTTLFIGKSLDVVTLVSKAIFSSLVWGLILFSILLLVDIVVLIYNKMINPLNKVRGAVANLSSGEADLTARIPVKSEDEFATLACDVNSFIELLQNLIKELDESQSSLNSVSEDLDRSAQDSASATSQILANIESVRKQSENQSESVKNTSNVLNASAVSVDELSKLIECQNQLMTESSAAIEQMLGNISMVTASVRRMSDGFKTLGITVGDGKTKLGSVDQKVTQIAEQSKMLVQANAMISQIASETNLLAMNAAIEAAHAGDAGKGFSVVAEEIRKLAENSSVQAKNISSELKGITNSIQDVVTLSHDSQTAFGVIVNQLSSTDDIIREITGAMEEQQNASKQIFQSLSNMKDQSSEVSEKAGDMMNGISNVTKDMDKVSQISATILGSMDEMSVGMQQISEASQNVSSLAETTKKNINIMNEKLGQFKI